VSRYFYQPSLVLIALTVIYTGLSGRRCHAAQSV
jgi:hypothetical protein